MAAATTDVSDAVDRLRPAGNRELSSPYSYYWNKHVLPAVLVTIVLIDAAEKLQGTTAGVFPNPFVTVLIALAAGTALFRGLPLKRVYWCGDHLRISGGRRSVYVSLRDIADVAPRYRAENAPRVRITLHRTTPFGERIHFIPRLSEWSIPRDWSFRYPVVADMLTAVPFTGKDAPPPEIKPLRPLPIFVVLAIALASAVGVAVMHGR